MSNEGGVSVAAHELRSGVGDDARGTVSAASIHAVFTETLGVRVPADDTDVIATGLLDSLGVAELLLTLEERFDISIDMATLDLDDIRSVRSIVALVDALRDASGA